MSQKQKKETERQKPSLKHKRKSVIQGQDSNPRKSKGLSKTNPGHFSILTENLPTGGIPPRNDLQYKFLMNQSPDPIFISRIDNFKFVEVNDRACDEYRYRREEFLKMDIFDIEIEAPLREQVRDFYKKIEIGKVVEVEGRNKRKDGSIFPVHVRFTKLDEQYAMAIVRDVTRQRQAEHARFQAFFESAPDGIMISDTEGKILVINHQTEKLFGYKREEILGKTVEVLIPDRLRNGHFKHRGKYNLNPSTRAMQGRELKARRKDGTEFVVEINLSSMGTEKGIQIISTIRDMTEQRQVNEDRKQSISLLQATLESTADGILVVDDHGKITAFNRKFIRMWQLPKRIVDTRDDNQAISFVLDQLKNPEAFLKRVKDLYSRPDEESFDILELKDGRIYERHSTAQRIGEKSVGRVWSFRDVTEEKHLEEQLQQSQKMEAIGQLAGGVAHDFNNLLTVITGYNNLLMEHFGEETEEYRDTHEIQKATDRASSLTHKLLAFSRQQILQPTVMDLNKVIIDLESMFLQLIGKHIEIKTSMDPRIPMIKADPHQIEQVILNLAINGRDAMANGGILTLLTKIVNSKNRFVQKYIPLPRGDYIMLTVSDTGTGMDKKTKARLFEPFFTTKKPGKGTGLGLSMVYGIVKQSGGTIGVENRPGHGATFRILFPRVETYPESIDEPERLKPLRFGNETILLVEDEPQLRSLLVDILEKNGYTVLVSDDSHVALDIAEHKKDRIHLLIADMMMPKMNGRELSRHIHKIHPKIKTLYMSGFIDNTIFDDFPFESELDFLQKPFAPHVFLERIQKVLQV